MYTLDDKIDRFKNIINSAQIINQTGVVTRVVGIVIEATGPALRVGDQVTISTGKGAVPGEVVGFRDGHIFIMPLGEMVGIGPGALVSAEGKPLIARVGQELLGRVLNGLGNPIDGGPPLLCREIRTFENQSPPPMQRRRIVEPLYTGIRAIDCFLTIGTGQRIAILAGSGVGKSVLMGMIARSSSADVNVIGLIGERGREVKDFMEKDLGQEGLKKSVVVTVTSDESPLLRIKGIMLATTIAEYFREQGKNVALLVDSLTRVAMGQREIGLSIGEPPTTRGYTPSVFAILPRILERAGQSQNGSITGFYTVLVEGDDFTEPISDSVKAILDGHIVLSRKMASKNQYPAIDVLESISRLMPDVTTREHQELAVRCRQILADYRDAEDLINIGAYVKGSSPKIDFALERIDKLNAFLRQHIDDRADFSQSIAFLKDLLNNGNTNEKA
ncbi:MAG: FliI/YscN family ATPase [candidate division Zixibacteria bacterium]|jgi:flagellum-specific ATP synthase|nr:FliI/YscN family ATPase [candidate division Zixibacteria bacterium]